MDKPPDGTVIRFVERLATKDYMFAAVWVEATNRWHLSGQVAYPDGVAHGELMAILAGKTVSQAEVSLQWGNLI